MFPQMAEVKDSEANNVRDVKDPTEKTRKYNARRKLVKKTKERHK